MFGLNNRTIDETRKVQAAAEKAAFRNFGHAAASIRKDMAASIQRRQGPAPEGAPPHTHKGQHLKRSFRVAYDKESAMIGPLFSRVGDAGAAHEFGENYRGDDYPERPFAFPALERGSPRFADSWQGSIGV